MLTCAGDHYVSNQYLLLKREIFVAERNVLCIELAMAEKKDQKYAV